MEEEQRVSIRHHVQSRSRLADTHYAMAARRQGSAGQDITTAQDDFGHSHRWLQG